MKRYYPFLIALVILIIDQGSKLWVKLNMTFNDHYNVFGEWFKIVFIENEGMAFGIQLWGGDFGKLFLSLFRIVAVVLMIIALNRLIKRKAESLVLVFFGLLLAGTLGNVLDSVFYGALFSSTSFFQKAVFMPEAPLQAYSTWLYGNVVDMLYFPLAEGHFPDWLPERPESKPVWCPQILFQLFPWANEQWLFFRPVFNIADAAISTFMIAFIVFYKLMSFAWELLFPNKKSAN
mgnify:CR=1 FL=1